MKRKLLVVSMILMLMLASAVSVYATNINVNGSDVVFTETTGYPYLDENGRTQVPLRVTMEKAGATVAWDAATKTATVTKRGITVQVPVGAKYIIVDGKEVPMDTAAVINNSKTYLPIRPVLEAVNFSVYWSSEDQTVFAANFFDYVDNQEIVVAEKRSNIDSVESLLDYLASEYRLQDDKEIASEIAERAYLDKLAEKEKPDNLITYFDWYTIDQLDDNGITVDDSDFTIERDSDYTECTFGGELVLEGKSKTITIQVPEFTIPIDDDSDDNTRIYDGLTISFSPWSIEFSGEDLVNLGLFN